MLVLITGMPRSGSTFTFNVAKALLLRDGSTIYWEPTEKLAETLAAHERDYDHVLIKQHQGDDLSKRLITEGAARAICSYRDPVDAMVSWMQVFGLPFDESLHRFERSLDYIRTIRADALMISFGSIERHPKRVIRRLAKHLGIPASRKEVATIAAEFDKATLKSRYDDLRINDASVDDMGYTYFDRATLMHRRHVRGLDAIDAAKVLSPEQLAIIRQRLVLPKL